MSIFDAYRTGEIVDLEHFIPVSDYFLSRLQYYR